MIDREQMDNWRDPPDLAQAAQQAVERYGQSGDAEREMQRLCAAVKQHKDGQGR